MTRWNGSVPTLLELLRIDDPHFVEIEIKRRVAGDDADRLRKFLAAIRGVHVSKPRFFFDQFIDTPSMDLLRLGASLRLRYKGGGSRVYLQYKGPGFFHRGALFRSEFSSERVRHVVLEESHHDVVHFRDTPVGAILERYAPAPMAEAMRRHLGARTVGRLSHGPVVCSYQKQKFLLRRGLALLEPSVDRVFAFHVGRSGLHPLSTFCEYENEIKADGELLATKLEHLSELLAFDAVVSRRFKLPRERLDKYHRCNSYFGH